MSEEKKEGQQDVTNEQIIAMIQQALGTPGNQALGWKPQQNASMSMGGWGQTRRTQINVAEVMASLQGVLVELKLNAGEGNAKAYLLFPPEFGQSEELVTALIDGLYNANIPVNTWRSKK